MSQRPLRPVRIFLRCHPERVSEQVRRWARMKGRGGGMFERSAGSGQGVMPLRSAEVSVWFASVFGWDVRRWCMLWSHGRIISNSTLRSAGRKAFLFGNSLLTWVVS